MLNPFSSTTPASQQLFVGRDVELNKLIKDITYRNHPKSVAILGGSKIGKTSLFNNALEKIKSTDDDIYYYTIIDAGYIATLHNVEDAFTFILQDINHKIDSQLLGQPQNIDEFDNALKKVEKNNPNVRILLAIDYAENIFQMPFWQSFTRRLTHLVQGEFKNFGLVFMGKPSFLDQLRREDLTSPLNLLLNMIRISSLSKPEVRMLIRLKSEETVPVDVEDKLILETGGHPFLIQWFMENLFDICNGNLKSATVANIDNLILLFYSERSECSKWFEKLNMLEINIYDLLVDRNWSRHDLMNMGLMTAHDKKFELAKGNQVDEALLNLSNSGFINQKKIDEKYFASSKLMSRYFRENIKKNDDLIIS